MPRDSSSPRTRPSPPAVSAADLEARRDFDGDTYSRDTDGPSMGRALAAIYRRMDRGEWHTLADLAAAAGITEAGASARIRDLRKPRFGGHTIDRRRRADQPRVWEYRLR